MQAATVLGRTLSRTLSRPQFMASHNLRSMDIIRGPYSITNGLAASHVSCDFTTVNDLATIATTVFANLHDDPAEANQFILVHSVPTAIIRDLSERKVSLDVPFRLEWEGNKVLIKVIPGYLHDGPTREFSRQVILVTGMMGIFSEGGWGGASIYEPPNTNRGKEGDDIFWPESRRPVAGAPPGWPTLVMETGVSQSRPRLRDAVKWWFNNSEGNVRIVITIKLLRNKVEFQKWQLLPPNAPNPAPRSYILNLKRQANLMPPFAPQLPVNQQICSIQEVSVTANDVQGAPMVLPFQAIFDRAPGQHEHDITITAAHFRTITQTVL